MKSVMDEEVIERLITKLNMYHNMEQLNFERIGQTLVELSAGYQGDNHDRLNEITDEIFEKLKVISKLHGNNISVLVKNLSIYRRRKNSVASNFDKLI